MSRNSFFSLHRFVLCCFSVRVKPAWLGILGMVVNGVAYAGLESTIHSEACEAALALSALPARLRVDAKTYIWKGGDFRADSASDAKFHCFVSRNHPDAVIPQCFTASGVDTIMAGEMYKTRLVMDGATAGDSVAAFDKKVAAGEYKAPATPGINYMMSAYNWIYRSSEDDFIAVPPHVMFFAPNVDPDEVGSAPFMEAVNQKGIPMVVESGIHAYMVTFTDGSSDSIDVQTHCEGAAELMKLAAAQGTSAGAGGQAGRN